MLCTLTPVLSATVGHGLALKPLLHLAASLARDCDEVAMDHWALLAERGNEWFNLVFNSLRPTLA